MYEQNMSILKDVYLSLSEGGYDPLEQITGYLLTEDPTYITNYNKARVNIAQADRIVLLCDIVESYFKKY